MTDLIKDLQSMINTLKQEQKNSVISEIERPKTHLLIEQGMLQAYEDILKKLLKIQDVNALKAKKWDELEEKISKIYSIEDESLSEEEGSLIDIGEISALAFGFL